MQVIVLGLDTGARFDGVAIVSRKEVLQTGMLELPKDVVRRMNQRRRQRRLRRYRKCRRRPCRFNNRKRPAGWMAPSQNAKVEFRLRVVEGLIELYPVTKTVVEDVRFDHYRKRWGSFFSTTEIGKTILYNVLFDWFGEVTLVDGVDTAKSREEYRVRKSSDKSE